MEHHGGLDCTAVKAVLPLGVGEYDIGGAAKVEVTGRDDQQLMVCAKPEAGGVQHGRVATVAVEEY